MGAADPAAYRVGALALDDTTRATYDSLFDRVTGLPTRVLLYDRLRMALARVQRTGTAVGVVFLRAEGGTAESVMKRVATVVAGELRVDDTLARTGPAELVAVCYVRDAQESRVVVRRIARACKARLLAEGVTVGFAVGVKDDDPGELLVRAAGAPTAPLVAALSPIPEHLPGKLRAAL